MEPARAVARWASPSRAWPTATRWHKAATPVDRLPPLSQLAAAAENACRDALLTAADLTALWVDEAAVADAVRRDAELDIDRLLQPGLYAYLLRQRLEPRLHTAFRHGAEFAAHQLRKPVKALAIDLTQPYREAAIWAYDHAGSLITSISERQREAVRRIIARANREGLTVQQVAEALRRSIGLRPDQVDAVIAYRRALRQSGTAPAIIERRVRRYRDTLRRQRALLIARTELITAVNAGQLALWSEAIRTGSLPRTSRKIWLVTEDERLCPECAGYGEEPPIPWNAVYGGSLLAPPAHPLCRCAIALA